MTISRPYYIIGGDQIEEFLQYLRQNGFEIPKDKKGLYKKDGHGLVRVFDGLDPIKIGYRIKYGGGASISEGAISMLRRGNMRSEGPHLVIETSDRLNKVIEKYLAERLKVA